MNTARHFMAVDIGTIKVCALAAEMTERGPRILAAGAAPSRGIKKGVVADVDEAAGAVRAAVREAAAASGGKIGKAVVGISGSHISGIPAAGVIGLQGRMISRADRMRAIDSAKTMYIPLEREILHVIPTEFILDGQKGIADPVGMSGMRLESKVYVITAHAGSVENLARCCAKAGLGAVDLVVGPVASALGALTSEETRRGALLIDIGGGTTEIALFRNGALVHAEVLGVGGLHITNDLAVCLNLDAARAEKLKTTAGDAMEDGRGGGPAGPSGDAACKPGGHHAAAIIRLRCEELFEMVRRSVQRAPARGPAPRNAVLTGGTAMLGNITGLAASVLGMPVRIGMPQGIAGLQRTAKDPACATGAGLLAYAFWDELQDNACDEAAGAIGKMKKRITDLTGYKDFLGMLHKKKKGVAHV
jgi:cell division protein FtsA